MARVTWRFWGVGLLALGGCAGQPTPGPMTPVTVRNEPLAAQVSVDGDAEFVGESEVATPAESAPATVAPTTVPTTVPTVAPTVAPTAAQATNLPSVPARQEVARVMRQALPGVQTCANGRTAVVQVTMMFNSAGRVTSVRSDAPPDIESCVHAKASNVRLPAFTRPTFRISYPFRLQ